MRVDVSFKGHYEEAKTSQRWKNAAGKLTGTHRPARENTHKG